MSNRICDFSSFHKDLYERLIELSERHSLFQRECIEAVVGLRKPLTDMQAVLSLTLKAQRLTRIFDTGLDENEDFAKALFEAQLPGWEGIEGTDVAPEMHQSLADKLYNITDAKDQAIFEIGDKSREVTAILLQRAADEGIRFSCNITDGNFMALVCNHADAQGIRNMADKIVERDLPATKRIVISTLMPETSARFEVSVAGKSNEALFKEITAVVRQKSLRGEMLTTLTFMPTRVEAAVDQIPYADYTRLFFEMCDQPWARISDAQKLLIEQFNQATHARFTNEWGTDIEMELVDDAGRSFTFCNSLIAKNVPGSEIFSAPRRDSVQGRIVSNGRFNSDHSDQVIENLRLHFNKGHLDLWGLRRVSNILQPLLKGIRAIAMSASWGSGPIPI